MSLVMSFQVMKKRKATVAEFAGVRLFTSMFSHMTLTIAAVRKTLAAHTAFVRSLSGVHSHMCDQMAPVYAF
ncbi:unnamed protein product [Gongylonema pulchrum]|uniref:Secreted protein n=1 Tax=Gongylonema pulchrum TaxID=637853 RepID=A0A183DF30_9BILA|nr:unnamed protein product [Gongylonema pulchrum]